MSHLAPDNSRPMQWRRRWGRPRFGYRANRIMLGIGARFLPLGYCLVAFATLYFFLFVPRARRASMAYLDRIHPRKRGWLLRCRHTYRHLFEFGLLLLDRAVMLAGPQHRFNITSDGRESLHAAFAQNAGLIMLSAHFGNAEAAAPYMAKLGLTHRIHLVMYQQPGDATERFHDDHRRMLSGMPIITTTDPLVAGVKIMRALSQGDVVAIRADRALEGRTITATLLGAEARLPAGPFLAAALSGAPVMHVYTCRLGYRRYACIMSKPEKYGESAGGTRDQRIRRAANDYAAFLDALLRKHPYQWSNFYDFWAAKSAAAEQPDVAP